MCNNVVGNKELSASAYIFWLLMSLGQWQLLAIQVIAINAEIYVGL